MNLDDTESLYLSLGRGQTFSVVPPGGDVRLSSANATEIMVGASGALNFSAFLTLMNGPS